MPTSTSTSVAAVTIFAHPFLLSLRSILAGSGCLAPAIRRCASFPVGSAVPLCLPRTRRGPRPGWRARAPVYRWTRAGRKWETLFSYGATSPNVISLAKKCSSSSSRGSGGGKACPRAMMDAFWREENGESVLFLCKAASHEMYSRPLLSIKVAFFCPSLARVTSRRHMTRERVSDQGRRMMRRENNGN